MKSWIFILKALLLGNLSVADSQKRFHGQGRHVLVVLAASPSKTSRSPTDSPVCRVLLCLNWSPSGRNTPSWPSRTMKIPGLLLSPISNRVSWGATWTWETVLSQGPFQVLTTSLITGPWNDISKCQCYFLQSTGSDVGKSSSGMPSYPAWICKPYGNFVLTIWVASNSSWDSFMSRQEKNFVDAKKLGSSAPELHPKLQAWPDYKRLDFLGTDQIMP